MSDLPDDYPRFPLPPLLAIEEIQNRLLTLFSDGIPSRAYVTRLMAARTVYVMLYFGCLPGGEPLLPRHVYRMTKEQVLLDSEEARRAAILAARRQGFELPGERWYADTTREPIRDETLRYGLVEYGAVIVDRNVATTSSEGRYVLEPTFAALFDPELTGEGLERKITDWRNRNLNPGALARVQLLRESMMQAKDRVTVHLPNGETRIMSAGMSSAITKAVVERFLPAFLEVPVVIWISESARQVVQRDDAMARRLHLDISSTGILPDMIAVDLDQRLERPLILFVEIVATDGPITEGRKRTLTELAASAGYGPDSIAFLTAFASRSDAPFKKVLETLAVGSFAWAMNEPEVIIWIEQTGSRRRLLLSELIATPR